MAKKKFSPMQHSTPPDVEELDRITRDLAAEQNAGALAALEMIESEKNKTRRPGRPRTKPENRAKTSFYLTKDLMKALKLRALDEGKSQSDIINEALKRYLE